MLSSDGDIYVFGNNVCGQLGTSDKVTKFIPQKLKHPEKFIDISAYFQYNISAAVSENNLYYIWGECGAEIITEPKAIHFMKSMLSFNK